MDIGFIPLIKNEDTTFCFTSYAFVLPVNKCGFEIDFISTILYLYFLMMATVDVKSIRIGLIRS